MKVSFKKILKGSQGLALFMVVFVMAFFLLFVTGGLVFSNLELKKGSNLKLATQALEVADAGLQHALTLINWGYDFNTQLNCGTPPCALVSNFSFPSAGSGFSYTVTARNDSDGGSATNDTNNLIVLSSTATGPNNAKKVVEAYVKRSLVSSVPPGAFYFPASSATIRFDGSSFFITGNDTGYDGLPATNPKPAITGVAPINNTVRDSFKTALGSSRYNLAQGSGYSAGPPVTPSVATTSNTFDVYPIATRFYNHPNAVKFLDGLNPVCPLSLSLPRPIPDPCVLGTDSSPQITYIRESSGNHIHFDGYITGSGVLVVEGKTHLYGNFVFHGLVVHVPLGVTGGSDSALPDTDELIDGTSPYSMRGNAKIFGAVLQGPMNAAQHFEMRNSAKIYYSSKALTMVNDLWGSNVPQPPRVFAWLDK